MKDLFEKEILEQASKKANLNQGTWKLKFRRQFYWLYGKVKQDKKVTKKQAEVINAIIEMHAKDIEDFIQNLLNHQLSELEEEIRDKKRLDKINKKHRKECADSHICEFWSGFEMEEEFILDLINKKKQ